LAANIGSPDRLSYLLVGDTINLASRRQSLTKEVGTQLIMSADTHARLTDIDLKGCELRHMPPTPIQGKRQLVEMYAMA